MLNAAVAPAKIVVPVGFEVIDGAVGVGMNENWQRGQVSAGSFPLLAGESDMSALHEDEVAPESMLTLMEAGCHAFSP